MAVEAASIEARGGTARLRRLMRKEWAGVVVLAVFYVIIFAIFSVLSPFFLQTRNLMSIGSNMSVIGLMAIAGTPLIVAGGLDLSVAAIAGLSGVAVSLLFAMGINIWLACAVAIAIAACLGGFNGFLTTRLRLNPLIVTLGTMSIYGGAALVLTGGLSKPLIVSGFNWLGSGRIIGVPVPLIDDAGAWCLRLVGYDPDEIRPRDLCDRRQPRGQPDNGYQY